MKVFASLHLIFIALCFAFVACDETDSVLDVVDDAIAEQSDSEVPEWQYVPEKNITLNFPEWLKDGSQGQIGLGEAHPHAPDESFELSMFHAVFRNGYIYIPDASATHVYVFDFQGNMLDDKTIAREIILGGRASHFAPHFGNVSIDGKFLRKTHPDQSVADFVRHVKVQDNKLVIEIGWWPGYANTWITRVGFAESTTTYWDLSTGEISFGRTDKLDCWIDYQDETGQRWTTTVWCEDAEQAQKEIDDNDGIKPTDYSVLAFSTEQHDYFRNINLEWSGYKILTKEGVHVGWFKPKELIGITDSEFINPIWTIFNHGIYYKDILYMLTSGTDLRADLDRYTFYAFQQN